MVGGRGVVFNRGVAERCFEGHGWVNQKKERLGMEGSGLGAAGCYFFFFRRKVMRNQFLQGNQPLQEG